MAKLIYSGIMSLDGYIADAIGKFDWSVRDTEVHTAIKRPHTIGRHLPLGPADLPRVGHLGRMDVADQPTVIKDFAQIWRVAEKVVYSASLETASSARTRIDRIFRVDEIRLMKATAERDISVGGPNLATHAIKAGLVDEHHLFVNPILVGGGTSYFPDDTRVGSSYWTSAASATALPSSAMPPEPE
jgi:hypothetical protein